MGKGKGAGKRASTAAAEAAQAGTRAVEAGIKFGERAFSMGESLLGPAGDFWSALLQGGQPARVAVGPAAAEISSVYGGTTRGIEENLPRGGERNLALAQADVGRARDISRLYAGVQPAAAGALGQLAGIPFGVSTGMIGAGTQGVSAAGPAMQFALGQQQLGMQGAGGIGKLLYTIGTKGKGGGGGGGGGK